MQKIRRQVEQFCIEKALLAHGMNIVVALSGGADSVCLARILMDLAQDWELTLSLVHVEHGIRGESARQDAAFCRELAGAWGVRYLEYSVDAPARARRDRLSLEEAARQLRYEKLEQARQELGADVIAVAHHQDDQAETMLYQLVRGSGLRGAGGIRARRGCIIRPLLCVRRAQIRGALEQMGQSWREDETNVQEQYARNRVRHQVIPCLEQQISAEAVPHLAQTAWQLQEAYEWIYAQAQEIWNGWKSQRGIYQGAAGKDRKRDEKVRAQAGDGRNGDTNGQSRNGESRVNAEALRGLPSVLRREVLLLWLEEAAGSRRDIGAGHVQQIWELASGGSGRRVDLPYGLRARAEYGWIVLEQRRPETDVPGTVHVAAAVQHPQNRTADGRTHSTVDDRTHFATGQERAFSVEQDMDQSWVLEDSRGRPMEVRCYTEKTMGKTVGNYKNSYTKYFDCGKIDSILQWRRPVPGDYLELGEGHRKKLGRIFIDEKIPRDRRAGMWVLAQGNHVLWIPELDRVSTGFYVEDSTQDVLCGICMTNASEKERVHERRSTCNDFRRGSRCQDSGDGEEDE